MKKGSIVLGLGIVVLFSISLIFAQSYSNLVQYYSTINDSCNTDSDCAIKNAKDCCGYSPQCVNKDAILDDQFVADYCNGKNESCKNVNYGYCRCQKIGSSSKRRCLEFVGSQKINCGDGNCFRDETNPLNESYCEQDCSSNGNSVKNNSIIDYYSCEKDEDCIKEENGDCCGCSGSFGVAKAINKNYKTEFENQLIELCKSVSSPCSNSSSKDPSCSDNIIAKCVGKTCKLQKNELGCPEISDIICPPNTDKESEGFNDKGCSKGWKCRRLLSNGIKAEVKIMPETASDRARERLGELGFNVTLKEVGNGDNTRLVYEVVGEKEGKMLGIFKVKGKIIIEVDANTGEILSVKKPWWVFLSNL